MLSKERSPAAAKEPLWGRNFILVTLANLAVFTGFQMLLPTLPVYVERLGGQAAIIGLVMAIFTLSAVAVRPFVGWALDAIGRRVVFLFGLIVFVVTATSYSWATSVGALLALRFVHGFGWGFSTTAAGTIATDVVPKKRLGEGMGFFGLASILAMATAPALGLFIINRYGFPILFYISAALAFLAFMLAWGIRYARRDGVAVPAGEAGERPATNKSALYESTAFRPALVMLLSNTTYGAIVTFIAPYAMQRGILNIGLFFTVYAALLALTRPIAGMVLDRRGYNVVVIPGLALVAVAMPLLWLAQSLGMFLLAGAVYGVGFGAVQPSLQALAVQGLPMNRRGAANGTFYNGFDLGIGIGSILWGAVAQATGYSEMYLVAAVPAALALAAYLVTGRPRRPQGESSPCHR